MSYFAVDRLPVELIHTIFGFLSCNDIFDAFFNTSSYMNGAVRSYNNYSVRLISVTRKKFDFILANVEPSQMISLALSNGHRTGGQFGLFLSRYASSLQLFTRLRSLTLHQIIIKTDEYDQLLVAFQQFKNLRFLHLEKVDIKNVDDRFARALEQLDNRCMLSIDHCWGMDLSRLPDSVQYYSADYTQLGKEIVNHTPWSHLRAIKLGENTRLENQLDGLFSLTPQLVSFVCDAKISRDTALNFKLVPKLEKLSFDYEGLMLSDIHKRLGLDTLSKLKDLQIRATCPDNQEGRSLLYGIQWEILMSTSLPHLLKFNFEFTFKPVIRYSLDTFRTPFWLDKKKWFVAFARSKTNSNHSVFTVPHFNDHIDKSRSIVETTSPSLEHLNSNVHEFDSGIDNSTFLDIQKHGFNRDLDVSPQHHRYEHIEQVELYLDNSFNDIFFPVAKLDRVFNLNTVKTLAFRESSKSDLVSYRLIIELLDQMPYLSKICLNKWPSEIQLTKIKRGNSQIRSIKLPSIYDSNEQQAIQILKPLFWRLFPSVEHVELDIYYANFLYKVDKNSLPWQNLASLEIKHAVYYGINAEAMAKRNQWKHRLLTEIFPRQSTRNLTFTDTEDAANTVSDRILYIWFGETRNVPNENEADDGVNYLIEEDNENDDIKQTKKKTKTKVVGCFGQKKCSLS